jgi:ABC-2 type transport system ATP-binding protein
MTPAIECDAVTRRYGAGHSRVTAVDAVDLQIQRGEFFGLLGTNGAGKTSLLDMLEGLASPDEGAVTVLGLDPRRQRRVLRPKVGMMLQSGGLPRDLTVRETLTLWHGTCTHPLPVATAISQVGLESRAQARVASLSGGEQRRLDLACALLGRPEIVFLDEPTTGLDPEARRDAWHLFKSLTAQGVTVVLTTHYLDEAESLCDRIALLHRGRVRHTGTVTDIVGAQPSVISFQHHPTLPGLPSALASMSDVDPTGTCIITSWRLQRDLATLLTWADERGLKLEALTATPASLESAYFSLLDQHETTPDAPWLASTKGGLS